MRIKFIYILLLVSSVAFAQITTTSVLAPGITTAGQGDLYLTSDTDQLYIGLSNGKVALIGKEAASGWGLNGNSNALATSFLGTTTDVKMNIGSFGTSILEFGRRQTLGLVQGYTDYTDANQYLVHVKGGGVSALQFEATNASFYKPMFFTTTDGNFRLKGSAAGTDFFEMGSAGTSNNGSFEFIVADDGNEPIVFKKYNCCPSGVNPYAYVEMMRMQGIGMGDTPSGSAVRVGIGINTTTNGVTANGVVANSVLQVGGSLSLPISSVTANVTLTDNDYTVILKAGAGTVTLPAASTCKGRIYVVKNISGVAKSITSFVNKEGINSTNLLNNRNYTFQSDGVDWQLINEDYSTPIRSVTASTILTDNDYTVILKAGAYAGTAVTLPAANTCAGRIYVVKNISGADRNISAFISRTGVGSTSLLSNRNYTFQSDGVDWQLINEDYSSPIRSVTASTILTDNDYTVILKAGAYAGTAVTLPAANTCVGRIYVLKNISGADRTISSFINRFGNAIVTLLSNRIYSFQSDGVDWQQISDDY
jgi:hypothetical protein